MDRIIEWPEGLRSTFQAAMEEFQWESKEQREGFLALIQYLDRNGKLPFMPAAPESLPLVFFIQRLHEATEYWRETFGQIHSTWQRNLMEMQEKQNHMERTMVQMEYTIKTQTMLLEQLTKK